MLSGRVVAMQVRLAVSLAGNSSRGRPASLRSDLRWVQARAVTFGGLANALRHDRKSFFSGS